MSRRRITELWAYLAIDPTDNVEGIVGMLDDTNTWIPLVGADRRRMESLAEVAREIARTSGQPVRLVRFTTRTDMEILT